MKYPFIFFNHGKLVPDKVNKNCECFIWFDRYVTILERELIVKSCPPPLSGLFVWGECFAYFGSGGDTFDYDIIGCYTNDRISEKFTKIFNLEVFGNEDEVEYKRYFEDRSGKFPEIKLKSINFSSCETAFDDLYKICIPRISEDFENWAKKTHKLVPISFIKGPKGVDGADKWNNWSLQQTDIVFDKLVSYMDSQKKSITGKSEKVESKFNYGKLLPKTERMRYFGYIFNEVLLLTGKNKGEKVFSAEEISQMLNLTNLI